MTTRPLGTADVVSRAIVYGVATFLGISTLADLSYLAVRVLLDRASHASVGSGLGGRRARVVAQGPVTTGAGRECAMAIDAGGRRAHPRHGAPFGGDGIVLVVARTTWHRWTVR